MWKVVAAVVEEVAMTLDIRGVVDGNVVLRLFTKKNNIFIAINKK